VGFKSISEVSTANGGRVQPCRKRVPDWSCNVETPSARVLVRGTSIITTFNRAEMWPISDVSDLQADLSKVDWASAADQRLF